MRTLALITLGLLLTGCPDLPEGRFVCSDDSDCPSNWRCNLAQNRCYSAASDAGVSDSGDALIVDGDITDADSSTDAGDGGDGAVVGLVPLRSTCTPQGEPGTRTFTITTLQIPNRGGNQDASIPETGFNLDGLTTTSNTSIEGCRKVDLGAGTGVDNALARINDGLDPLLLQAGHNYNANIQASIAPGVNALQIVISDWNLLATDPCLEVMIRSAPGSATTMTPLTGRASLSMSKIELVSFESTLAITPTFKVFPDGGLGECTSSCQNIPLRMPIQQLVARLYFSPDMATIGSSSQIGGYVRYFGADANAFSPGVTTLFNAIEPSLNSAIHPIYQGFLDLDSSPELEWCSATNDAGTTTSADSFSATLSITGTSN